LDVKKRFSEEQIIGFLRAAVAGAAASAPVQGAGTFVEVPQSAGGTE
jgi:hypothetical protein